VHFAYIWIVSHLSAKNYRNLWKFDKVLTKTNLLSFFWDRCISDIIIVISDIVVIVVVVLLLLLMLLLILAGLAAVASGWF